MPKAKIKTPDPLTAGIDLTDPGAWVSVNQLPVLYPALWSSINSVRWDMRNREQSGLAPYVRVIGKKTIAHRDAAARWKLSQAQLRDPRYA
jgi:hypothetical protein